MARKKSRRRDWRVIVFVSISLIIVVSMVLSSILLALPGN
jgi:predicted nucleic acid-binding Zn ribbon protein